MFGHALLVFSKTNSLIPGSDFQAGCEYILTCKWATILDSKWVKWEWIEKSTCLLSLIGDKILNQSLASYSNQIRETYHKSNKKIKNQQ